jgi:hypothetical protein
VEPGTVAIGSGSIVPAGAAAVGAAATAVAGSSHPLGIDLPVAGATGSVMNDRNAMPGT